MGYKLWEVANRDGVVALLPFVKDAVLRLAEQDYPTLSTRTPSEVGEPLARYVHGKLMSHARPLRSSDPAPPNSDYTHIAYSPDGGLRDPWGSLAIKSIISGIAEGVMTSVEEQRLAASISRQLSYHKLAKSIMGTGHVGYWIRPWPESLKWDHLPFQHKEDRKVEKRIRDEADKPVIVSYSSKAIIGTIPAEIDAHWATEVISKLVNAYDHLAQKHATLNTAFHEVNAKVEELQVQIEALTVDPKVKEWEDARDKINAVLQKSLPQL